MRFRKILVLCFCCIVIAMIASAQSDSDRDYYAISDVKSYINTTTSAHLRIGFQEKLIWRLGDRSSIALLKIYTADELRNPQIIRGFLPVIHTAFENPTWIEIKEDRKPQVTLFFLAALEKDISDEALRKDITAVIDFVKKQGSDSPETKP